MAMQDNSIQSFKFADGVSVRSTLDKNGSPWFLAADVCAALEIVNTTNALKRLDEDELTLHTVKGKTNGNDQASFINESGLYSLILTSRKAEAKRFKKWVTAEVLPAIRKTGSYGKGETGQALALVDLNVKHYWVTTNSRGETVRNVPLTSACKLVPLVNEYFDDALLMRRADMLDFMDEAIHTVWEMDKRLQALFAPMRRVMDSNVA